MWTAILKIHIVSLSQYMPECPGGLPSKLAAVSAFHSFCADENVPLVGLPVAFLELEPGEPNHYYLSYSTCESPERVEIRAGGERNLHSSLHAETAGT